MTDEDLRDCFAMFVINGIASRGLTDDIVEMAARNAYKVADAMLEARKQKENEDEEDAGIAAVAPKRSRRKR